MAELIDRAALLKALDYARTHNIGVRDAVKSVPIIDAEPVVHARWIPTKDSTGFTRNTCSNCGRIVDTFTAISAPYCHCGARMDADDLLKPTKHDAPERAGKEI